MRTARAAGAYRGRATRLPTRTTPVEFGLSTLRRTQAVRETPPGTGVPAPSHRIGAPGEHGAMSELWHPDSPMIDNQRLWGVLRPIFERRSWTELLYAL